MGGVACGLRALEHSGGMRFGVGLCGPGGGQCRVLRGGVGTCSLLTVLSPALSV